MRLVINNEMIFWTMFGVMLTSWMFASTVRELWAVLPSISLTAGTVLIYVRLATI